MLAAELPETVDALYIGGGFPETHAAELARNRTLLASVKEMAAEGLPVYAECGGLMLLSRGIRMDGRSYAMAGVLPCEVELCRKPQGHGYVALRVDRENPYFPVGMEIKGHEFHYSRITAGDALPQPVCSVVRGDGCGGGRDGIVSGNVWASYTHIHALGTPEWAGGMVAAAQPICTHEAGCGAGLNYGGNCRPGESQMTALLFGLIYVSLAVSGVACVVRAVRYTRLPLNLRWELYPVPHEDAKRAGHGGSYFEELDWWTRPVRSNRLGELKAMTAEILFLHAMYRHNRTLWRWSYPFHLGLYLLIATGIAAVASAAASLSLTIVPLAGLLGCVLVMTGTAGLLVHRIKDQELRIYSAPMDYFNLAFFFVTAAGLALAKGPGPVEIAKALLTFNSSLAVPVPQAVAMALAALLIAYIPMTHMAHFIGKYFTYHAIRWGDRAAGRDRSVEQRIAAYLGYKPSWAAPHIGADGATPWSEIVARNPADRKEAQSK